MNSKIEDNKVEYLDEKLPEFKDKDLEDEYLEAQLLGLEKPKLKTEGKYRQRINNASKPKIRCLRW